MSIKSAIREGALYRRGIKDENFEGALTRVREQRITPENEKFLKSYSSDLMANKVSSEYFNKKDGDIYYLVRDFFNAKFGTPDGEICVKDLLDFCSQRWYYITTPHYQEDNLSIKKKCKEFRTAYYNGKEVSGEDPVKEAVWIATHAFVLGLILNTKQIFKIIPRSCEKIIPKWNNYVSKLDDIPEEVKDLFMFEDGKCKFCEMYADTLFAESEHPKDDIEEESSKEEVVPPVIEQEKKKKSSFFGSNKKDKKKEKEEAPKKEIVPVENTSTEEAETKAAQEASALDEQYKNAVNKPERTFSQLINNMPKAPNFGGLKFKPVDTNITFGSIVKKANGASNNAEVTAARITQNFAKASDDTVNIEGNFIQVSENNRQWHNVVPRLSNLTKQINACKYQVIYVNSSSNPLIIKAYIFYNKQVINVLNIDPGVVYGDTLRIITVATGDMRTECFIPISQEDIVNKAINGVLVMSDVNKINKKIPGCLFAFDNDGYTLLDRVDFSGIVSGGKNGLPFDKWKELVQNCYNETSSMKCRFRVANYESPKKFDLVCDEKVRCAFNTNIVNEQMHQRAVAEKLIKKVRL